MGFISKEVNLPHQMLFGCSFFFGGEGESGHWNPSDFATSTLCLLIVSLCRSLLGGHFCNTVSQQTLWSSVPYSLSIPSSFTFLGCWWKSCVADVVIFNEFRTNILSLHCVQLLSFTGKSRPLMRTESYLICEYKEKLQNVVKIFFYSSKEAEEGAILRFKTSLPSFRWQNF